MSEDDNRENFKQKLINRAAMEQRKNSADGASPDGQNLSAEQILANVQQNQIQNNQNLPPNISATNPPNAGAEQNSASHHGTGRFIPEKLQQKIGIDSKTPLLIKIFRLLLATGMVGGVVIFAGLVVFTIQLGRNLPAHEQLQDYQPKVSTRVHAGDGKLLAEFAVERRIFVPIAGIPEDIKYAFISAEDKNFYQHKGLDFLGIMRAVRTNIQNIMSGNRNLVGASTITQQVAKNFLLTREQTFTRKFKEAIIARRIEKVLSKDRILELYLNEIFLGNRSYGVAAAAADYLAKLQTSLILAKRHYWRHCPKHLALTILK